MFELLKDFQGPIMVNGKGFSCVDEAREAFKDYNGGLTIMLNKVETKPQFEAKESTQRQAPAQIENSPVFQVSVRRYMTNYDDTFFLTKMNEKPMPYMTMYGRKLEETKGLIKMELWGDMTRDRITSCMRCGRPLSNPLSQYLGLGPECGAHEHMAMISSGQDVSWVREEFRKVLGKTKWTGWIVRSAILEMKEVEGYQAPELIK